ncbi:hypothetical protein B0H16DRAFT_1728188 [Mycena metata]|uniref:DUF6589 domain-containing protein n=1 Tax=Mycena metata TaxID=1033252 RepID=A0AAD7IG41_9AGAR|nr:hypothetical protein B0H16DRAFT_1728188 [Mycena metata]
MDDVMKNWGFRSLGDFLAALFHPRVRGEKDNRSSRHRQVVAAFLQGRSNVAMADIIPLIYNHLKSRPKRLNTAERSAAFSPYKRLTQIRFAAPCLSAWATRIVGDAAYARVGKMARKPKDGSRNRRHLRASTNGRSPNTQVVDWEDVEFTVDELAHGYKDEDQLVWFLTECFAGSRKNGKVVVKKTRPHPVVCFRPFFRVSTAINPCKFNGDIALPIGLWLFATQAHIDVKRVLCRFGYSVSGSTACRALNTMTDSDLHRLKSQVQDVTARGEVEWGKISDNIQRYDRVYEHGIGRESELKVGTACTAFRLDACKPGAFRADDHIKRVIQNDRKNMTTESVYQSINWNHVDAITELHYARVLAAFIPHLNHLSPEISARFRTTLALHRLNPHKTILQPLGTNSEHQIENKEYQEGFFDFDRQMGVEPEKSDDLLSWSQGDGRLVTSLTTPNIYKSFRNAVSTPEVWHTKATNLNSNASNHYGPAASPDPSSLSRSSNATNMKRPSDLKKLASSTAGGILVLECDADLIQHFDDLAAKTAIPTLEDLLEHAHVLRECYATQAAYERAVDKSEHEEAEAHERFPEGTAWTAPCAPEVPLAGPDADAEMPEPTEILDTPSAPDIPEEPTATSQKPPAGPQTHKEPAGFNGDRVLSNSILFLREFGG